MRRESPGRRSVGSANKHATTPRLPPVATPKATAIGLASRVDDPRYLAPLLTSVATGSFVWSISWVDGPFFT